MKPNILFLTCANEKEANKIFQVLLEKHLVVCIKKIPTSSSYLYKGKIESATEILLIMDTIEENFTEIESEIKKLHSYKTFVLISLPIHKTTNPVLQWVKEEISIK